MNLSEECDLEDYINRSERVSAADIAAICAEAGLHAVRANRYVRWAIVRDAVRAWTFFPAYLHVSVCLFACLPRSYVIMPKDFEKAYKNVTKKAETTFEFYQ
jgi:ATP-dependent 26S proteasome regulatory subunit